MKQEKGVGEIVNDLWLLTRDYAEQETGDPLQARGEFLAYGIGGSLILSLGVLFGAVAVLRCLQTETGDTFSGNLNFIPYVVSLVFTIVCAALAVYAIKKPIRAEEKQR